MNFKILSCLLDFIWLDFMMFDRTFLAVVKFVNFVLFSILSVFLLCEFKILSCYCFCKIKLLKVHEWKVIIAAITEKKTTCVSR